MKKVNLFVGVLASLGVVAGITSCGGNSGLTSDQKSNVEAFTGITFLNSVVAPTSVKSNLLNARLLDVSEDEAQMILPTLDALLTNGVNLSSKVNKQDTTINGKVYNYVEKISFKEGNRNEEYTLVYNKESKRYEENELFETEVTEYEKQDGFVVFGDLNKIDEATMYSFVARSESETEDGETEFERTFKINIDNLSYILVEEENEQERFEKETEFKYKFVKNGKVDLQYSISIENNKFNFSEVEYTINNKEYEAVAFSKNGKNYIRLEVEGKYDIETTAVYLKNVDENGNVTFTRQ